MREGGNGAPGEEEQEYPGTGEGEHEEGLLHVVPSQQTKRHTGQDTNVRHAEDGLCRGCALIVSITSMEREDLPDSSDNCGVPDSGPRSVVDKTRKIDNSVWSILHKLS